MNRMEEYKDLLNELENLTETIETLKFFTIRQCAAHDEPLLLLGIGNRVVRGQRNARGHTVGGICAGGIDQYIVRFAHIAFACVL